MTIKDLIKLEKKAILHYFTSFDKNGKPYESTFMIIRNAAIVGTIYGILKCIIEHSWTLKNFLAGIGLLISIILVESVLMIPIYFLGKKYPWINKNREKALIIAALIVFVLIIAWVFLA